MSTEIYGTKELWAELREQGKPICRRGGSQAEPKKGPHQKRRQGAFQGNACPPRVRQTLEEHPHHLACLESQNRQRHENRRRAGQEDGSGRADRHSE